MQVAIITGSGTSARLALGEVPAPRPGPGELLLRVSHAGVNRADVGQMRGRYPPPPGTPDHPGLECFGVIEAVGSRRATDPQWEVGGEVCALLPGGGFAEFVTVDATHVFAPPPNLSPAQCAGLPEVAATVWSNVFMDAGLKSGESILIHGGASGIGSFATQLAKAVGARVVVTASAPKVQRCLTLGADHALDYREPDLAARLREAAGDGGFDVILDVLGGPTLDANIRLLARGGRLVVISFQHGSEGIIDLRALLSKRARLSGSTLRNRPPSEKAAIIRQVVERVLPLVASDAVIPVIDSVFPLAQAGAAVLRVERSEHFGKVVIEVDNDVHGKGALSWKN